LCRAHLAPIQLRGYLDDFWLPWLDETETAPRAPACSARRNRSRDRPPTADRQKASRYVAKRLWGRLVCGRTQTGRPTRHKTPSRRLRGTHAAQDTEHTHSPPTTAQASPAQRSDPETTQQSPDRDTQPGHATTASRTTLGYRHRTGAIVVLISGTAIGAVAFAQPDGDTFYACEKNGSVIAGTLSVNTEPTCRGGAVLTTWNQQGPQGPPGEAGPPGTGGGGGFGEFFSAVTFTISPSDCPEDEWRMEVARQWGETLPWPASSCTGLSKFQPSTWGTETRMNVHSLTQLNNVYFPRDSLQMFNFYDDGAWRLNCFAAADASPYSTFLPEGMRASCFAGSDEESAESIAAIKAVFNGGELESGPVIFYKLPD
jgi:hypothetical protein